MIDSNYKLSLDSIDSNMNLTLDKFKKVSFNKSNYYDELIPYFYKDLPVETAFGIKYDNDVDTMSNDFSYQYDELYQYGARNIIDNKNYTEEYEYFSPLYITKTGLPKKFIIFRVDGPGIGTLSSINFKTQISNKLKTVKIFDLTKESILGEWLNTNFTENKYFPDSPLEMDFRNLEFCRWNGIDYQNGGYTSKSLFIDDILDEEKEIFELEKFVFDSYKNNKVVFPNILNLSFLFDDTPSTPEQKRKWSINRYYGFYLNDLELVTTMSPYIPIPLKNDIIIGEMNSNGKLVGNILYSKSESYPFTEAWSDKKPFYVEYNGNYYKVEQFTETITNQLTKIKNISSSEDRMSRDLGFSSSKPSSSVKMVSTKVTTTNTKSAIENYSDVIITKYRIISDLDLTGKQLELNKNNGKVELESNRLIDFNNNDFYIDGFYTEETKIADIWLIEIDGILHNLIKDGLSTKIYSDYSFDFSNVNSFTYKVAGVSKQIDTIVDFNNSPKLFKIYKAQLTDIKDFDDRIVDTEFSKYEYENSSDITNTDETKMYFEDLSSKSDPRELDDFIYKNNVIKIPVSSEYTANYETFKIDGNDLSEIWRKNSSYCRFGFQNSLSGNDVPYLLNNSLIFEDYNRTSNPSNPDPIRVERNLDYFYTINSSTASYIHHTLHIEKLDDFKNIDLSFRFELDKYLNIATYSYFNELTSSTQSATYSFDYFSYIFGKEIEFFNGKIKKNTNKYSYFNVGDDSIPNHSLFRGIKFDIYKVDSINLNSTNQIDKINISTNNDFNDYKLSILLSDNDKSVTNTGDLISSTNSLSWDIIDEWKMNKEYLPNSYVIFDDILYKNGKTSSVSNFSINEDDSWSYIKTGVDNIFWNPTIDYRINDLKIVYNSGEYYYSDSTLIVRNSIVDFWNPTIGVEYIQGNFVIYKNKYYISLIDNNIYNPTKSGWLETSNIKQWNIKNIYSKSDVVISDSIYYIAMMDTTIDDLITNGKVWKSIANSNPFYKWNPIEFWNPSKSYGTNYIVHDDVVYKGISGYIPVNEVPKTSSLWKKIYSLLPDTNFKYNVNNNSIIEMNDKYYHCNSTTVDSTLDNGIIIYINKKWKNILININIADNTYGNDISGTNRDNLYNELYKKITAANFMSSVNDITSKYGFSDYISYVIIEEDGTLNKYSYDNNIKNLPYILKCEGPDSLDVKVQSLLKRPVLLPNTLNPTKKLENGKILNINQLNYYNNNPIASNIIENKYPPKVFENYHGGKNIIVDTIYRFSGYYTPLFYNIDIFKRDSEFKKNGNYLFDTTLTNFGIMKERKIRKINRKGSILKLKDVSDEKSIYPMLDEFGYSVYDFFIFSSTWDLKYYLETDLLTTNGNKDYLQRYTIDENVINNFDDIEIPITIPSNIGPSQN